LENLLRPYDSKDYRWIREKYLNAFGITLTELFNLKGKGGVFWE
jgi:hypothetical protein